MICALLIGRSGAKDIRIKISKNFRKNLCEYSLIAAKNFICKKKLCFN